MTWQPRVDPCFLDLDLEFEIRPMFLVCFHSPNTILNVSSNAMLNAILNASSNATLNVTPTPTTCDRKEHERESTTREKQAT